ncbi:YSIRK-type signal peptide-containing protein, partial [Peptostreptococcus porci]|uniref:YSIRK-type signal peptide-containing protein n=1 Tax=Peptostreptococcus porci TaxID=2652282 RepID=UPI002A75DC6A
LVKRSEIMRNNRFKTSESKQRFSIRKCNVGVVSVLLGLSFAFIAGNQVASADEVANIEAPAAIVENEPEASAATAAEPEASVAAPEASTAEAKPEATAAPEASTTEAKPEVVAAPEAATTEAKPAATAINVKTDGKWTENEPVLNKDAAEKDATITRDEEKAPDGYKLTEKADFRTFLILSLSGDQEPADKTDKTTGSFNHRFDKDWYIRFSTDAVTDSGKVLAELVDKNDNNRVLEEKELLPSTSPTSVQFDTIKNLVAGSTINANKSFKYEMKNRQHNFTGKDGKTSIIRNLEVLAGVGDSALSTPVYAPVTPGRVGVVANDISTIIPVKAVDQVTKYVLKGTDTVKEKELASYTQSGGMSGDNYTIPGAADFEKYVLIESPAVNEGILSPSYVKDSFTIRTLPSKSLAKVQLITKSDGTSKFMTFVLNPDHTDVENYYKKDNLTADDLKLNEIIDIINNTTLSNDEKVKEIKGLNAPYLLMFISNDVAPNKVSSGPDFLTGEKSWSYESKRRWRPVLLAEDGGKQKPTSNTISANLELYDDKQTAEDWRIRVFELVDQDDNPIDFKGNRLTGTDRVQIGGQYITLTNSYLPASGEAVYYYAEKQPSPKPDVPGGGIPGTSDPNNGNGNNNGNQTPGNNGGRDNYRKVVKNNKKDVDKLPQMGNEDTNNFAAIGAVALAGAIGVAATSKRKEEN